jgi:hypothetical protein
LPDLTQVNLYSRITIFSSHKTFHATESRTQRASSEELRPSARYKLHDVTFAKVVNKVKYSEF